MANKTATEATKTAASKFHAPGLLGFAATTVGFTALDMASGTSMGKAFGTQLLYNGFLLQAAPGVMWGQLAFEGAKAGVSAYFGAKPLLSASRRAALDPSNMNFRYTDTQQALTMRQAAVQAIQGSHLNARSALGGEARLMHRGTPTLY